MDYRDALGGGLGLGLVTSLGCTMPTAPEQQQLYWPDPEVRYYGLSAEIKTVDDQAPLTPEAIVLNQSIRSELKKGSRIAFRPPDKCSNVGADSGATETETLINSVCGSLLGALETVAAERGYEVVSYKYLKDISTIDASDRFDIDAVFELDDLDMARASGGTKTSGYVQVFRQENESTRRPVSVREEVHVRCKKFIDGYTERFGRDRGAEKEIAGAQLSAKAVSAKQGIALFSYRKFLPVEAGGTRAAGGTLDLYFASTGSYAESPPPPPPSPIAHHVRKHQASEKAFRTGLGLIGLGAASYLVGYGIDQLEDGPQDGAIALGIAGITFMALGGAATIGGAGGMIGHKMAAEKKLASATQDYVLPPAPEANYKDPETVLCKNEFKVTPPWLVREASEGPRVEQQSSSVYTFEDSKQASVSAEARAERTRQEMSRKIAADMFDEIEKHL